MPVRYPFGQLWPHKLGSPLPSRVYERRLLHFDLIFEGKGEVLGLPSFLSSEKSPNTLSTALPPRTPPSRGSLARPPCMWRGWVDFGTSWLASGVVFAVENMDTESGACITRESPSQGIMLRNPLTRMLGGYRGLPFCTLMSGRSCVG